METQILAQIIWLMCKSYKGEDKLPCFDHYNNCAIKYNKPVDLDMKKCGKYEQVQSSFK